jgi:hypothetical protein
MYVARDINSGLLPVRGRLAQAKKEKEKLIGEQTTIGLGVRADS